MKKILFLLLLSIASYGQTPTGQEQEFDYGIKNNAAPTVAVPNYLTTQGMTGVYGKIEPINLPLSTAVLDSLAVKANKSDLPATYAKIVYVNATSPTTATIFDLNNPPVTNDDLLKNDTSNLYIGTDASTWVYDMTVFNYVTKSLPAISNFYFSGSTADAGSDKIQAIKRNGTIEAPSFIKTGGLVSQALLANGAVLSNPISGTGTTNYIPKFTASGVIGNSNISDNGSLVSVGLNMSVNGITVGRGGGNIASNTSIGTAALGANTTGTSNNAFGNNSLGLNTTGLQNNAFGATALYGNTTGNYNIGFGYNAGRYITDNTTTNANGMNSIFIGYNTKALGINQTNQIVIGDQITGLGSNSTVIGNASTTKTAIYGNLLLGTTTDDGTNKLQVNGSTKTTALTLTTTPTTSEGTYDFLTRNTSTGLVEKVLSNTIAPVASPTLTGTPTAPTATAGTNTTQIATTAFVTAANSGNVTLTGNQTVNGDKSLTGFTKFENSTIIPQFGTGLKSRFFTTNSEGVKAMQDWTDGNGNVRAFLGDVNNSIPGTAFKLIGTQGRSELVELALMQTNTVLRDYGTTLTTQPTTSNFQIGIRKDNVESVALEIDNSNNKLTYTPGAGGMFSINANGFSPMLTMYNNGGVSEWAIYQGQNPFDDDLHFSTKISSSYSEKFKIRQDGIAESAGFKILSNSDTYLLKNGGISSFLYDSGTMLGVGRADPTRLVDILAGSGVSPFRAMGVNGNILIDNAGTGINYFSANDSHIFQINGIEKMKINTSGVVSFTDIPTAPTATAGTNTTQIATTAFVQSATRPYKVYTALLTQSGTAAPTDVVLENTLGGSIVWSYSSAGVYHGTLTGAFLVNKSISFVTGIGFNKFIGCQRLNDNVMQITSVDVVNSPADTTLISTAIEIRVYN
jgi:hypothetical protein